MNKNELKDNEKIEITTEYWVVFSTHDLGLEYINLHEEDKSLKVPDILKELSEDLFIRSCIIEDIGKAIEESRHNSTDANYVKISASLEGLRISGNQELLDKLEKEHLIYKRRTAKIVEKPDQEEQIVEPVHSKQAAIS